ncbi:MAG: MFS transporter [Thermoplasmatales archaeon]|nr:MFS transporter [Thermoplasmatales archaeon]
MAKSFSKHGYIVLVAVIIGYMGSFGYAYAIISPILVPISTQFNISETTASLIATVMFIGAAIFAFPGGVIVDKWSLRKATVFGQGFLLIGWFVSFISMNFPEFLIGRFIIGLGGAVIGISGATSVVQWFAPQKRMIPMGLWSACLPIGIAWGEILAGEIVSRAGWRTAVLAGIIITIACLLLVAAMVKSGPVKEATGQSTPTNSRNGSNFIDGVVKNKEVWKFNIALILGFIPLMTITTYWVAWLMNNKGIGSVVLSSSVTSLIGIAGIFGAMLGGYIASLIKRSKPVFVYPALAEAIAILLFVFARGIDSLILLSIVIGLTSYMLGTMLNAIPPQLVSAKFIGSEYGIAVIFFYSAGIVGPLIIGDLYSASGGLIVPGILMLSFLVTSALLVSIMKIR